MTSIESLTKKKTITDNKIPNTRGGKNTMASKHQENNEKYNIIMNDLKTMTPKKAKKLIH